MAIPLLIGLLLVQGEVGAAPTQAAPKATKTISTDYVTPLTVVDPLRLAISPKLDGTIGDEEWDPLATLQGAKSFFAWEPGAYNLGAVVPKGHDAVFSIDLGDNGWLVGKDNLEVRLSFAGGKASVKARIVDATLKSGPSWVDLPNVDLATAVSASEGPDTVTYEASVRDALGTLIDSKPGKKLGIRFDVEPTGSAESASFVPRALSEVSLVTQRNAGCPKGLVASIERGFTTVVPGEKTRIRVTFKGENALGLQRFEAKSAGYAKDYTTSISTPFPAFDNKGRAFVDYTTLVARGADPGYRVMRATITSTDGLQSIVEGSYRIAPVVDFGLLTNKLKTSESAQVIKLKYAVRSNSGSRVIGGVGAELPTGWRNISAPDKGFTLYGQGWTGARVLDIEIPGGAQGIYPIKFKYALGDQTVEQTEYLTISK